MGRPTGTPKTGGRQAGTPNKKSRRNQIKILKNPKAFIHKLEQVSKVVIEIVIHEEGVHQFEFAWSEKLN